MLKKIIGTAGTRIFSALMSFGIIIITSHNLGAKGLGTIGLIMLAITLNQLLSSLIGGPPIVYFIPRLHIPTLYFISCTWAVITSVIGTVILQLFHLIPDGNFWHVLNLSLMLSLASSNTMILLGKERIGIFNAISVLQLLLLISILFYLVKIAGNRTVWSYVLALYISYAVYLLFSFASILKYLSFSISSDLKSIIKPVFRYGLLVQLASILQLLNYRLSYYLIGYWHGKAAIGKFDVGVKLSEGMWLIGKSLSLVQYTRIVNVHDLEYSRRLTLGFLKATLLITFVLLLGLLLLPGSIYIIIFGKEFGETRNVIFTLAPGILALSSSIILSSFFSGNGKPQINTIASGIGLVVLLASGFLMIPKMGIIGAGLAASASYISIAIYQWVIFTRNQKFQFRALIPGKKDAIFIRDEIKQMLVNRQNSKETKQESQ
jgi:O-antigen/teichoic acid export membrane protein